MNTILTHRLTDVWSCRRLCKTSVVVQKTGPSIKFILGQESIKYQIIFLSGFDRLTKNFYFNWLFPAFKSLLKYIECLCPPVLCGDTRVPRGNSTCQVWWPPTYLTSAGSSVVKMVTSNSLAAELAFQWCG